VFAKRKSIVAILKEVMTNESSALLKPTSTTRRWMPTRRSRNLALTPSARTYVTARHGLGRRRACR
jgi:hypothetical protein